MFSQIISLAAVSGHMHINFLMIETPPPAGSHIKHTAKRFVKTDDATSAVAKFDLPSMPARPTSNVPSLFGRRAQNFYPYQINLSIVHWHAPIACEFCSALFPHNQIHASRRRVDCD